MKLREWRVSRQPRLMIIPMIDIIFFLLVFFMLSTLYMVEQKTLPVQLPAAQAAQADMKKQVAVTVTAEGQTYVDEENVPLQLLGKRVQLEMSRQQEAFFVLRADKRVEYGRVVAVMDALKAAGVQRLSVATEAGAAQP